MLFIKYLSNSNTFKICLLTVCFLFFSDVTLAQGEETLPISFTVSDCEDEPNLIKKALGANGDYEIQSGLYKGCPCYNKKDGSGSIIYSDAQVDKLKGPSEFYWVYSTNLCGESSDITPSNFNDRIVFIEQEDDCNIVTSISDSGSSKANEKFLGCQLSNVVYASSAASIPTLSEWGLIILVLLLMTAGTLYLVQPSVRESLEQEG